MIYTACYRQDGQGRCDLYISEKKNNRWTRVKNMGTPINTGAWESHASLSVDGKTLYYVSTRKGSFGKTDIWKSERQEDGTWSDPINLGDVVNSKGREMTPFIHPDGKTLYFASDGHMGMGGLDFFMGRLDEKGNWSEPVNLGYPINTHMDEQGMIINATGELAYISSSRMGGVGKHDIYTFELYNDVRPVKVNYMQGVVRHSVTKKPLKAKFELIDLATGEVVVSSESDAKTGAFFVCIPSGREYALNVSKENYLFHSETFSITGIHSVDEPFKKNVYLKPFVEGEKIVLKNVFFETAKFDLKEKSNVELNKLVALLQENPSLKVEIGGHTDNVGNDQDNLKLSEERAKAVYDYVVSHGIDASRLTWKGYGESTPTDTNDTPEGRANNRRTELTIIGVGN
jgi:outer membrane protein OmpA-like peptidoglycan-associated protein